MGKHACVHCSHNEDYLNCNCTDVTCRNRREEEKEREKLRLESLRKGEKERERLRLENLRKGENVSTHRLLTKKINEKDLTLQQRLYLGLFIKVCKMEGVRELVLKNTKVRPTP